MEYMIMLHSDEPQAPDFQPGTPEFEEMMGGWMAYNQMLIEGGHWVAGASLAPPSTATTFARAADGTTSVTDGPFAETKEQIGGFYLVAAKDLDEAIALAEKIPMPAGYFEVRPVAFRPEV